MLAAGKRSFSCSTKRLDVLAFIETANGRALPASWSTLTAAKLLGKPVTAILAGPDAQTVATDVAKKNGVSKVLVAAGARYAHYLAEELAPLLKDVIQSKGFTHFVAPASVVGKSLVPRLGALLDVQPISDITQVVSEDTFFRPIYAGNALATVKTRDKLVLATVRAAAFPVVVDSGADAPVEPVESAAEPQSRTRFVSQQLVVSERPELGSASRVVSGGRGLKNKANFDALMEPLAAKLKAAIGASRAAVDAGYCDNCLQVGQTGKIVAPELYVAVGISGAIQHLAGMKDAKTIVAINKDPEAPIFNVADIGLVADLNEAIPELANKL